MAAGLAARTVVNLVAWSAALLAEQRAAWRADYWAVLTAASRAAL